MTGLRVFLFPTGQHKERFSCTCIVRSAQLACSAFHVVRI